jgi:hypothetical protein
LWDEGARGWEKARAKRRRQEAEGKETYEKKAAS